MAKKKDSGGEDRLRFWRKTSPSALSSQENLKLIMAYRQAEDEEKRAQIRDQIVYGNMGLVHMTLSKTVFTKDEWQKEDLLQEGVFTVLKVIDEFDPEKGSFSNFLFVSLENTFRMIARHNKAQRRKAAVVGLDDPIYQGDSDAPHYITAMEDVRFDSNWILEKTEKDYVFEKILPRFSQNEQEIFKRYFVQGYTLAEIGKEFGVTRQTVKIVLNRMCEDIKEIYSKGADAKLDSCRGWLCDRPLPKNATLSDVLKLQSQRNREIFERYQNGQTLKDVAEIYSLKPMTAAHVVGGILKICKEHDIKVEIAGQQSGKAPKTKRHSRKDEKTK